MLLEHALVSLLNRLLGPRGLPQARGLRLGELTDTRAAVTWPTARRAEHLCVVGKTGSGKTYFLETLADQLMDCGEPWVFFDYHGDATDHLVRLAARHADAAERLVVIDPSDETRSPGLNLLEVDPADHRGAFARTSELAAILRQRWSVAAFGPRTEELLRNTLYMLAVSHLTLVDAPRLLTQTAFRQRLLVTLVNAEVRDYWLSRFEPLSEPMKATFREPLLNKITGFLTDPACRHFLGQQHSTIDFARAIETGQWVVVCLPKGKLREHAHTLGNLIFARLQFDILARVRQAAHERRLVTLFCDEVQNLAENDLTVLLTEGRKFQVSVITGQQHWAQTSADMRGSLLSAGTHVFFRVSGADAAILAAELSSTARTRYQRELTLLSRGEAIARIGGGSPLLFTVPALTFASPGAPSVRQLRDHAHRRYARPRRDIDAEIAARRETTVVAPKTVSSITHTYTHGQTGW
jgi:hypothetical protein